MDRDVLAAGSAASVRLRATSLGALAGTSLAVGAAIYVLFRAPLRWYSWATVLGAGGLVDAVRGSVAAYVGLVPDLALWSLPNALWVLSGTLSLGIVTSRGSLGLAERFGWLLVPTGIAVGAEAAQWLHCLEGTADLADAITAAFAGAFGIYLCMGRRK